MDGKPKPLPDNIVFRNASVRLFAHQYELFPPPDQ
jgi:hypothetical protein